MAEIGAALNVSEGEITRRVKELGLKPVVPYKSLGKKGGQAALYDQDAFCELLQLEMEMV